MEKNILFITACFISVVTFAQQKQKPDLVTDRPDQTEAPVLVPAGAIQIETGFQIETDRHAGVRTKNFTYNTTLLKYGVNEHFELRMISEYLGTSTQVIGERKATKVSGLSPLAVGLKIKLSEEQGWWPQAALIGHINLVSGSQAYAPDFTAADFRLTFANTLSEKLTLSYNLGAEWDGETPNADFLYTLSLGYKVTDRIGAFIEGYSFFPEHSKADNRIDGGITFLITPVVQWDVSGGIGLSDNSPDSFVSTGLSIRLLK
jgi:hypothetical protein